jgi:hypothetical protein
MLNYRYFDGGRDRDTIGAGGFFCQTCLVGKPALEQSPDPRYCQGCYDFLSKEMELDNSRRAAVWKPVFANRQAEKQVKDGAQVSEDMCTIMSTMSDKKFEVDIINPPAMSRTPGKRGPRHRTLPDGLINQWASEGMGSKAIATKLKGELGIEVSYKTIQRVLSGERKRLVLNKVAD